MMPSATTAGGPVVVTGATGFVGRHVCAALAARGIAVRRALRGPTPSPRPGDAVVGDIAGSPQWARALDGAGAVVHLAARVHVMRERASDPDAAFGLVNVEGTRTLLDAMASAGVPRAVFASSVKAVGETSVTPWTEGTAAAPVDAYGRSKRAAESLVEEWAGAQGRCAAILRLPLVYGPGVGGNLARLARAVERGLPVPVPAAANRRSLVFVGNVADAVASLVRQPSWVGAETYFVADDRPVSTEELVSVIAAALGRRARLLRVPTAALLAVGAVGDVLARVAPWPFTSAAAARLTGSLEVDASRLWRRLGHPPPYTLTEGIARMIAARGSGAQAVGA